MKVQIKLMNSTQREEEFTEHLDCKSVWQQQQLLLGNHIHLGIRYTCLSCLI